MPKGKKTDEITVIIPAKPGIVIDALPSIEAQGKSIHSLVEYGENPSLNRNRGAKAAKTDIIAFINAHSTLSPEWSDNVHSFFAKHPEMDVVGGPQLSSPDESFFGRASGYALGSFFGSFGARGRYRKMPENLDADETLITSANLICRRSVFNSISFDPALYPGEDPKFIADAKKAGLRVAYSPEIVTYNRRRGSLFAFMKQVYLYGKARPLKESIFETARHPFFFGPSFFVLYLILLPLLVSFSSLFLLPLVAYAGIGLLFAVRESLANKELIAAPLVLFLFAAMHTSYGLGFARGLMIALLYGKNKHA